MRHRTRLVTSSLLTLGLLLVSVAPSNAQTVNRVNANCTWQTVNDADGSPRAQGSSRELSGSCSTRTVGVQLTYRATPDGPRIYGSWVYNPTSVLGVTAGRVYYPISWHRSCATGNASCSTYQQFG